MRKIDLGKIHADTKRRIVGRFIRRDRGDRTSERVLTVVEISKT